MRVYERVSDIRAAVLALRQQGRTAGFVPTMGALHAGHVSLMQASRKDCDATAVSIFVNPTQFGPNEDFQRYPRPRDADLELCEQAGVDLVFYPQVEEMYPSGPQTTIEVAGLSDVWEGAIRPGHFRGVATVVAKLFLAAPAEKAYFGQKDYQQQLILRRMVRDLHFPVEIVTCPILRDADGLALSSRNAYLSPEERRVGLAIPQALGEAKRAFESGQRNPCELQKLLRSGLTSEPGLTVDYAVVVDAETLAELDAPQPRMVALVAARAGKTRLIDNEVLETNV